MTLGVHNVNVREIAGTGPNYGWTNAKQTSTVGTGSVYQLVIAAPTAPMTAGVPGSFYVSLEDSLGNDVPTLSNLAVYITSSSPTALLSPDGNFATDGVATLALTVPAGQMGDSFFYQDSAAGQRTVTASDSLPANGAAGIIDSTVSLNVAVGPPAVAFSSAPFSIAAGALSPAVTVELTDVSGNPTPAVTPVPVYLSGAGPGAVFYTATGSGPVTTATIGVGATTATFTMRQTVMVNSQTVIGTDNPAGPDGPAGLLDASQTEAVVAGAASQLVITSSAPATVVAGTPVPVTVAVQNVNGVTIPVLAPVVLYLRSTSGGAGFSPTATPWTATTTATLAPGASGLTLYYEDTLADTSHQRRSRGHAADHLHRAVNPGRRGVRCGNGAGAGRGGQPGPRGRCRYYRSQHQLVIVAVQHGC